MPANRGLSPSFRLTIPTPETVDSLDGYELWLSVGGYYINASPPWVFNDSTFFVFSDLMEALLKFSKSDDHLDSLKISFLNPDSYDYLKRFTNKLTEEIEENEMKFPFKVKHFYWYSDMDNSEDCKRMLTLCDPEYLESVHLKKGEMKNIDWLMEMDQWKNVKEFELLTTIKNLNFKKFGNLKSMVVENNELTLGNLVDVIDNFTSIDLPTKANFQFNCKFDNDELEQSLALIEKFELLEDEKFWFGTKNVDRKLRVHFCGGTIEGWIISKYLVDVYR